MNNCVFCGAPLDNDALFCANCGKKIEKHGKTCPRCRSVALDESVFCAKCGTKLDEVTIHDMANSQTFTPEIFQQKEDDIIYDQDKDDRIRKWKSIFLSFLLVVMLIVGGYIIYKNYNNSNDSTVYTETEREPISLLGIINDKIEFSMRLHFVGNEIIGTEQYLKQKSTNSLKIKGSIDENGNMTLYEFDNLVECGKFEGRLTNFTYTGIFTNSHGKEMPFSAQIVSEIELEEKKNKIQETSKELSSLQEKRKRHQYLYSQLLDKYVNDRQSDEYMDESYFLFDITRDNIPELWLEVTDWSGNYMHLLYVYTVSDGQLKLLYKGNAGHPAHHMFCMGNNYIILDYCHMGSIARYKYEYEGGKVVKKELFNGSEMDESLQGYYELTEPHVITSDITDKNLLNSF